MQIWIYTRFLSKIYVFNCDETDLHTELYTNEGRKDVHTMQKVCKLNYVGLDENERLENVCIAIFAAIPAVHYGTYSRRHSWKESSFKSAECEPIFLLFPIKRKKAQIKPNASQQKHIGPLTKKTSKRRNDQKCREKASPFV